MNMHTLYLVRRPRLEQTQSRGKSKLSLPSFRFFFGSCEHVCCVLTSVEQDQQQLLTFEVPIMLCYIHKTNLCITNMATWHMDVFFLIQCYLLLLLYYQRHSCKNASLYEKWFFACIPEQLFIII